ncbi:MAG TPA: DegT/DnrJ/EryC1/StrS family aminotransferase [Stellaceae bacterium]|nr:DegT/DnrJ/EryC1/StrS family aminotransferase [Stellaceae bacterium]
MSASAILQSDPGAAYRAQQSEIDAAIARVLARGWYILGEEVAGFERDFARYIGAKHAIGVANGTDALVLALKSLDLGREDYVVTVAHTAVATVAAIELAGVRPLLVDIEPESYVMDATALARVLKAPPGRIGAIIPVHLYGQAADLAAILPLAREHGIPVIEDCAQCHGARFGERRLGSLGDVGCFSFYPTKNLGALGDGGIVVTADDALAARLRAIREYGWRARYVSDIPGMNSRLDEVQAAVLRVKLPALDAANTRRAAIADAYDRGLAGSGLGLPWRRPGASHVFHQYVVRSLARDRLRDALTARGIGTNIHYPVPIHLQPAYRGRIALDPGGLAESEAAAREVLSLPMYPQLDDGAVAGVIAALRGATRRI